MNWKGKVLIDFDDVHPEEGCGGGTDRDRNFKYLNALAEEFPEIKITLFTTPDWTFRSQIPTHKIHNFLHLPFRNWPKGKFRLTKFPEWCEWLSEKIESRNFEIGVHGLHHFQAKYPCGAEFENLGYNQAKKSIREGERIFRASGLRFVKIFRPPGWGSNPEVLKALVDLKYSLAGKIRTLSPLNKDIFTPQKIGKVLNFPANCDARFSDFSRAEKILDSGGFVLLHGHIESRYGISIIKNGASKSYENLRSIISEILSNYGNVFCGFGDIL